MAALLIESLFQNKSSFQITVRVIELLLLSAGFVSTLVTFKGAVSPCLYDFMLSNLRKPLPYFSIWLSSTLYICITMNLIVVLIVVSSSFHHPKIDNNADIEDGGDVHEDYDMHGALSQFLSPPPTPPPMQNNQQKQNQMESKPKEIFVVAEVTATVLKDGGNSKTRKASLKNQQDPQDIDGTVEKVDDSFLQEVFSDFSGMTEAEEIKKAQTPKGRRDIRSSTASSKNQQDPGETNAVEKVDDESLEAIFSKLSKLTEVKEIKMLHSIDSSPKLVTTKNGQRNQLEQAKQELENLGVEDQGGDTMEETWRAIKEGGAKPKKKQLKKRETWPQSKKVVAADQDKNNVDFQDQNIPSSAPAAAAAWKDLKKSMTFNDTVSIRCRGGLRRDLSSNREEFHQRVEAFIKKFNNEMRLQRQESEQRYLDMINGEL